MDTSPNIEKRELIEIFKMSFFPYGGGELLGYKFIDSKTGSYVFDPSKLKKWNRDGNERSSLAQPKEVTIFGLDTASFLIIDLQNLEMLINLLSYESLIDALIEDKLNFYFDAINGKLGNKGWAFVSSEGIDTDSEFDGDGSYILP